MELTRVKSEYRCCIAEMGGVRKIDSYLVPTTKTSNPDPVSLQILDSGSGTVPISAMLLVHPIYQCMNNKLVNQ